MLPPRLSAAECAAYVERERLTMTLALRAGYVREAFDCLPFIERMTKHMHSARWHEKEHGQGSS